MSDSRLILMDWLLKQQGKPYIWTAKGPDRFDCSGLVTFGLTQVGVPNKCDRKGCPAHGKSLTGYHNAQRLFDDYEELEEDEVTPLDLAFYGPPHRVDHVVFVWGDGRIFGANGGNSHTTSPEIAAKQGACVKFRPSVRYRKDFRGYRRIPLL